MGAGTIGGVDRISVDFVPSRDATIWFARNVSVPADKIVSQSRKGGVLRERHGSQAIAGASGGAGKRAKHVHPENHLPLLLGDILCLLQRCTPGNF